MKLNLPKTDRRCRKCDRRLIPVVYGFPSRKLGRAAARGKVVLGGCLMGSDSEFACPAGHRN